MTDLDFGVVDCFHPFRVRIELYPRIPFLCSLVVPEIKFLGVYRYCTCIKRVTHDVQAS